MPAMTRKVTGLLLVAGTFVGLALRWPTLFSMGVFDMDVYFEWGRRALEIGIPRSYHGIYFPLQYQVFEACAWAVVKSGWQFFTIYKLPNLVCDCGSFCFLVLLLRRQGSNPLYALIYWLHPWFLTIFSLGYIDFQIAFCILFCVWLLRGETTKDYLLAGLPLALAFLMKPQALVLIVATFAYGVFHYLRGRDPRPFAMLTAPVLLFAGYEWWFIHALRRPRLVHAAILPASYLNVTNIMPALTAQMTNIWYPVAYLLRKPGEGTHLVSDRIHVLPYLPAKYLAAIVVLGLIGLHISRVERETETPVWGRFAKIFGFATLAVPFLMTSAHENHVFLGTVFLVLLIARPVPLASKVAIQVLLLVQFLHIYSLYGAYPSSLAELLKGTQSNETMLVYAVVSVACFWFIAKSLWPRRVEARLGISPPPPPTSPD